MANGMSITMGKEIWWHDMVRHVTEFTDFMNYLHNWGTWVWPQHGYTVGQYNHLDSLFCRSNASEITSEKKLYEARG